MAISDLVRSIKSGEKTAVQLVSESLAKAKQNGDYHALLALTEDRALVRAHEIDDELARGKDVGVLAGIPFVVKDNYLAFGAPTTAASKILQNFEAPLQATVVDKLEAAGAICIGKANLDAFAHGGSTENSAYGVTHNAIDKTRVAGGSSGGSAVSVALDIVPFALGTDTGGSIRQPASFNGVYGYKPTYGMASRYGVVAMASSTDVVGCFARSVEDIELVIGVMAGQDDSDPTTLPDYFQPAIARKSYKIGIIRESMTENVDLDVTAAIDSYTEQLVAAGHSVEPVSLPLNGLALAMYYIIVPAEVSSNLARYDSVRYGMRASGVRSLAELYGKSRDYGFEPENKRRIMIGSYVLSSGFFDAYYLQASRARTLLIQEFDQAFDKYDFLLSPTTPSTAFEIGEKSGDPMKMYLADVMTVPASLAGLPAINIPIGVDSQGLPIGAQLIGKRQSDADVLAFSKTMEELL